MTTAEYLQDSVQDEREENSKFSTFWMVSVDDGEGIGPIKSYSTELKNVEPK